MMFASFFGVGHIKPFSASWASLLSGVLLYFFWPSLAIAVKIMLILVIFTLGCLAADYLERKSKRHDPSFIVIDEVVGMMIATIVLPQVWSIWIVVFLLFRLFDIAKPWPASFFDRQSGGFPIMIDDVIAALYTLGVFELAMLTLF